MSGLDETVLREVPGDDLALVLWQYLRHIKDWTQTTPAERAQSSGVVSFPDWVVEKRAAARILAPKLEGPMNAFERWLRTPDDVRDSELADACEEVAAWAYAQGFQRMGALYADAAAHVEPHELRRAMSAAKLARDSGDVRRAEVWFTQIINNANARKKWVDYIRANLGLGILYMMTKQDQRARKHFVRAAKKARREGYEWLAAEAQHDLFQFMTLRGQYDDAEHHARTALAWYPKNNPRLPYLIADVAFLMICQRHYAQSAILLRQFLRTKNEAPHNLLGLSMFVRALGAMGERRKFARMRRRLLREISSTSVEAAARWHLAEGERAMERWPEATAEASASLQLSIGRGDQETAELAKATLREVEAREPAPPGVTEPNPRLLELVAALSARIAEWAPTKRGRPRQQPPENWKV